MTSLLYEPQKVALLKLLQPLVQVKKVDKISLSQLTAALLADDGPLDWLQEFSSLGKLPIKRR